MMSVSSAIKEGGWRGEREGGGGVREMGEGSYTVRGFKYPGFPHALCHTTQQRSITRKKLEEWLH